MRKIELIEMVADFLRGGDSNNEMQARFQESVIAKTVEAAYDNAVFATFIEFRRHSEYSNLDAWAKEYTIPIVAREVVLPYPPIPLPEGKGIRQVAPIQSGQPNYAAVFAYRESSAFAVFSGLESEIVSTRGTYSLQQRETASGNNISVLKLRKIPDACTSVSVMMIVPLERIDDYDYVPMPAGKELLIVQSVKEMLVNKPPADNINDNNPSR